MIVREKITLTTASGADSENLKDLRGIIRLLVVTPSTLTTAYDFTLTDDKSVVIYSKTGVVGELRDNTPFPISGVVTAALANASADEAFTLYLSLEESSWGH